MGKGDLKTKKGKRFRHSYGNSRHRRGRHNRKRKSLYKPKPFRWSVERIYYECGRFNRTTNIVFREGSSSAEKYGQLITGDIYYPPDERIKIENSTKNGVLKESDGNVKFRLLLKQGFDSEKIRDLQMAGFPNTDILRLVCYSLPSVNEFTEKGIRKLPKSTHVITVKSSFKDGCNDEYNFYNQRVTKGEELIKYEKIRYIALTRFLYPENYTEEFKNSIIEENVDDSVEFEYLYLQKLNGKISDDDNERLQTLTNIKIESIKTKVEQQFNDAGIKKTDITAKYSNLFTLLIIEGAFFKSEILLFSSRNIYWDYDSFLHIVFRHIMDYQFDKNYTNKDILKYNPADLKELICIILYRIGDEIKEHFTKHPNTSFTWGSKLSEYFKGDYFKINISSEGRLETLYSSSK